MKCLPGDNSVCCQDANSIIFLVCGQSGSCLGWAMIHGVKKPVTV
jgi:hypothetical protein